MRISEFFENRPSYVVDAKDKPKKVKPTTGHQSKHPYQGKLVGTTESSQWGEPEDVLRQVLQTLERDVEWPLTDVMDPQQVKQLLSPLMQAISQKLNSLDELDEDNISEDLRQWFKDKWVRFGPDGKIKGDCARGSDSEGKPKCLPQSKAHSLGKDGRASAARRKRREDPNPERKGAAKNVATKKESVVEYTNIPFNVCPRCGGDIVHESQLNEKQDACYHKVKSRYKVWPSAYASGALVQCRKKGAKNWGNSKK